MAKKIEENICPECDSRFKLAYTEADVSGFPKFCPFCGGEDAFDTPEDDEKEYDEE